MYFHNLPHDSGGVLWFHVGQLCVFQGKQPRLRGYFWAILDIIMKYFEVYSI